MRQKKKEENEKAGSHRESNPGHPGFSRQCSATELRLHSYSNWTATSPHNPLYVLHRWYWIPHLAATQHVPSELHHVLSERSTPNGVLRVAARCVTEAFSTTCVVHIECCEGWWLFGCRSSVAEHWWLKPGVSWVQLQTATGLFTFPLFAPHNI